MSRSPVLDVAPLSFPWQTLDPFLFCVHHDDRYPPANEAMGPAASLAGRNLGMDFEVKDGWRMYHGDVVPGFPRHPHRGFETITMARRGLIDHSDSLGATARFGQGDVQWMTAGQGVEHSEMFPLLDRENPNRTELFQIWLNLPRAAKMVTPHFTMFWAHDVPQRTFKDDGGRQIDVTIVAGELAGATPPAPPPDSWAASGESDIAVWTIKLAPGARWTLPRARPGSNRVLYFFEGESLDVAGTTTGPGHAIQLHADQPVPLENGGAPAELLLLQGKPIGEPVVHHGPFVMNSPDEIRATILDYQRAGFGEWKWPTNAPVHPRERGRFAVHADGREENVDP